MSWFGKIVGGTFGFVVGGPIGAVLGAALGHRYDVTTEDRPQLESNLASDAQQRIQMAFFTATFSIMGHVAKADGRVSEAEIAAARTVMARMELPEDLRLTAIRLFNLGKQPDFPLDATLEQFRSECPRRTVLFRMFVELQLEAALADGALREPEERLLLHICDRLRFSRFEFFALRTRMEAERRFSGYSGGPRSPATAREPSLADAYAVLGLTPGASRDEVKRTYRKLMSQHHPDKLVSSGMPEEMVRIATEKTQQIRHAYEVIAKTRAF